MSAAEWIPERSHRMARRAAAISAARARPRRQVMHDPGCDADYSGLAAPDAASAGARERAPARRAADEGPARQGPALVMVLAPLVGLLIWVGLISLAF